MQSRIAARKFIYVPDVLFVWGFLRCCEWQLIGSLELGGEPRGFIYDVFFGAVLPYSGAADGRLLILIYLWKR